MKSKVDAIFELRDAAEEHGRAISVLEHDPQDSTVRETVLEARAKLEAATAEAIDSSHHCGLARTTEDHAHGARS